MRKQIGDEKVENSEKQARLQLESIIEMVRDLTRDDDDKRDAALQTIRGIDRYVPVGWYVPGTNDNKPTEYCILLCTGGPAVRIIGDLNEYQEPETARLEHQDWFTQWTELNTTKEEQNAMLLYAQVFYFGGC